jgi:sugar lactone lactonase YvrE
MFHASLDLIIKKVMIMQIIAMKKIFAALITLAAGSMLLLAQPAISHQPTNQVVINGGTAMFGVSASGTGPFAYQWHFNGTNFGSITTAAGNGIIGYTGDGGKATNASLSICLGVTVDSVGNLFIADGNSCIRKVAANGIISTVAGNGTIGYSGDGGAAVNAMLSIPSDVIVDSVGNLFIVDYLNNCIRKVATNGIITTVENSVELTYLSGVTIDSMNNLFFSDFFNRCIRKMDTNGVITIIAGNGATGYSGDGGVATNATFASPDGLMVDNAGNLLIADADNNCIRKVDTNGIITTVAGNGTAGYSGDGAEATNAMLSGPSYVTVDNTGNLFISDRGNVRIREVDTNGIITTVAGDGTSGYFGNGGPAASAASYYPSGVAVDSVGNLFIADADNYRIRKVAAAIPSNLQTLTIGNITTNNIGNYSAVISNSGGNITSSVASLDIPTFIISQPQPQSVWIGGSITSSITAGGSGPLAYQWTHNGTNINGATNNSYVANNVSTNDGGYYTVTITNPFLVVTSGAAIFTVNYITQQPGAQVVANGGTATLSRNDSA